MALWTRDDIVTVTLVILPVFDFLVLMHHVVFFFHVIPQERKIFSALLIFFEE